MSSFEVLSNGVHESFDSSDFSMIPDQPMPQDVQQNPVNGLFDMSNMQSAFMSASQDLSMQEIQNRLVELVEDNETMKEALKNNNSMMKEQLSTISAWHNEMTTSMSKQQISLNEAKGRIVELEKENSELLGSLKGLKSNPKIVTDSVTSTRDDVFSDEDSDFEIVPTKRSESEEVLRSMVKQANDTISELKKEIKTANSEITTFKMNSTAEEKRNSTRQTKEKEHAELQIRHENLQKQVDEYHTEIKQLKSISGKYSQDLESKVKDLNERLILANQGLDTEILNHKETKRCHEILQANYDRVSQILHVQSKDQREKNQHIDSERETEAKKFLEQLDNLTAQLFDMEQKLEEREEMVKELTSQRDAFGEGSESIPILKAQVELFKVEVDNAILDKDAARAEIDQLNKKMADLQASALFCSNCGAGSSSSDASRTKGRRKPGHFRQHETHPRQDSELIVCPVCDFGFADLQAAENHVNNCIDKSA